MIKSKLFIAGALAVAGVLGTGVARAGHADVRWSVTIGTPMPVYTVPAPVYAYPAPVYVQPRLVYHEPSYRPWYGDPYRRSHGHHRYYREPTHWDRDGDGIPNHRDRVYNPRWDIDGDGVPNRHDRDVDGDGIPNWHERGRR
ncbi:hypothetical protein HLB44_01335 [Aquincola sp. S2]|uniref:Uncharacterized protein n=1 Tax=Pseudaquabacterium terrae TaxID=2732868 RepID=A0ABX2EA65_9BURK|nr:PXPV repeat protein [Aquabacterium terrae]NRF65617.1 hypothetical protein [Aquabacterium terrae]